MIGRWRTLRRAATAVAAMLIVSLPAAARPLTDALDELLATNKKIKAAEADMAAANEQVREALGAWYPKLDVAGSYGYERQLKGNNTRDTKIPPRQVDLKITQLLWDFGSTNAAIENARLAYEQAKAALTAVEQAVLLEGITAYLDLARRRRLLEFARASEDNIKRQTALEDARVERGRGLPSDVLQAKTQLAGAQARRVRAEGTLQQAANRYVAVFYKPPDDGPMIEPRLPIEAVPTSLDDIVKTALDDNPALRRSRLSVTVARNNVTKTTADKFAPILNLNGQNVYENDFDGTVGQAHKQQIKVEMKYSINLGLTALNTLRASEYAFAAAENRHGDAADGIIEQARNAWQELLTAKENAAHLHNQANIAAEFLDLARKERDLGRRSLIDVLSAETALINASSDAASADTDIALSVYKILSVMGKLTLDSVK
jgi:adhesin transport system outer membrane protein